LTLLFVPSRLVWSRGKVEPVLVELSVVEQRYQAVLEVLRDGSSVTEVAARLGMSRNSGA
jgi:DNA-binding NarL/FixJ family response regulator